MDPNDDAAKHLSLKSRQSARIKAKIIEAGLRFVDIERTFNLTKGAVSEALRNPHLDGERAIAAALGTRPELLWRDRYHASGQRKSPPDLDYSRAPSAAQRQNLMEART
ncbi:helix-turn-helix domain-containing protein [Hoeflea sp. WL0058]|uniref:Helix-turn-helix domain-containing protein n=1 Tax=Flavimaribacter sediminis TaxID=2865987 RepID=A0AAE2ZQM5_9HYPH|nr:helix-turn-helix domain-containing protein [Flavimaribacter sediminis]MBW8638952.1 helix-turn-helix domain-containing protein [Flavimaribacter sediminis]